MIPFVVSEADRRRGCTAQPERSRQARRPNPRRSTKQRPQRPAKGPDKESGPFLVVGMRRADPEGMGRQ